MIVGDEWLKSGLAKALLGSQKIKLANLLFPTYASSRRVALIVRSFPNMYLWSGA